VEGRADAGFEEGEHGGEQMSESEYLNSGSGFSKPFTTLAVPD
jgi:hypothetical protein